MSTITLAEADLIELYTYLIISARTQLDDPHPYASIRLLSMVERLADMVQSSIEVKKQTPFYSF